MKKRMIAWLCAVCFLFVLAGDRVMAAENQVAAVETMAAGSEDEIMPLWNNINGYQTSISIEGSTIYPTAYVDAKAISSISITMTLQRQFTGTGSSTWNDVQSWTTSGTSSYLHMEKEYTASRHYTYRTKAVYTVNGETITTYSNSKVSY